jgi:hypothetical protein
MLRIRNDEVETRTEILTRFPLKKETEPTDLPTLGVDSTNKDPKWGFERVHFL